MRRLAPALLLIPLLAGNAQRPADTQAGPSVRYGVTKSRDTVTVGEPFEIRVRVRVPADATIRFPENPDTAGTVQARDPRTITVGDTVQTLDLTAVYHVAAWDVGRQPVRIDDVIVTWGGVERRVPIDGVDVFVRSVLPADSALRVPKPPRPIFEPRPFPWWLLWLLLAATAIGLLIWWWRRRKKRPRPRIVVDPYVRAVRELNRIEAMGLVDAGERTRFVALVVEVLRDYVAAVYPEASLALTSRELVVITRTQSTVPSERLSRVLHEADLAKFAAFSLTEVRARNLARETRAILDYVHKGLHPQPQKAA
ncbi:MAG TPA: DUF4381 family protein [Gemmatimonadaceae bacterium]|nr:DUF4381 family protein [Gemmatimonadaceae bacterium]